MKHPKTSHRLSKTIGQIKKVSQVAGARKNSTNSYTEMIKPENVIYEKKKCKNNETTPCLQKLCKYFQYPNSQFF